MPVDLSKYPDDGYPSALQVEKLFCLALLDEGTDVVQRVASRFIEYRDSPPPQIERILTHSNNTRVSSERSESGARDCYQLEDSE